MIYGIGTDIVEIGRIEKAMIGSEKFAARILTETELEQMQQVTRPARFLAKRFASKEAFVKALGTGIGNGVSWKMIQIDNLPSGQPQVRVFGTVKAMLAEKGIAHCHISISDELAYASAVVVLEGEALG